MPRAAKTLAAPAPAMEPSISARLPAAPFDVVEVGVVTEVEVEVGLPVGLVLFPDVVVCVPLPVWEVVDTGLEVELAGEPVYERVEVSSENDVVA